MLWDTHMHCRFSGDSEADPADMKDAAIHKGLAGICFTDHLDLDYIEEPGLFDLDIPSYREAIQKLASETSFPVRWGIEIGLQPHLNDRNRAITEAHPFDYVIGSVHLIDGYDPYFPDFYNGKTEEEVYRRYFECILENLKSGADFDSLGHMDYVVRYGPNKNRYYSYEKYADLIDPILREVIAQDKALEVNTAGLKYGIGQTHPCYEALRRYYELGGRRITLGSDAHKPEHVAYDFELLPEMLKGIGFTHYTVFRQRKPELFPL